MALIKVSGETPTKSVAGAIAGSFRDHKYVEAQAIGPIAVNQAVKALVLARSFLAEDGYQIVVQPELRDVEIDGNIRTAVRFVVTDRGQPPQGNGWTEEVFGGK
jgi:stage V sporulation protein S